jgi:hypothetical protein
LSYTFLIISISKAIIYRCFLLFYFFTTRYKKIEYKKKPESLDPGF